MGLDELFEADYVNTLGVDVANQTILLRRVDFARIYIQLVTEFATNELCVTEEKDRDSVSVVFSQFGSLLTKRLFENEKE